MAEGPIPRPVSGEIMSGSGKAGSGRPFDAQAGDIVDAEFEVTPPARSGGPDINMLREAAPARARRRQAERGGPLFWGAGLALAALAFWVSGGHALFADAMRPTPGQPGLAISTLTSRIDASGPSPILLVDGQAGNSGAKPEAVPPIEIAVTDNAGTVTRYLMGTGGRLLAPGEKFDFSSRLDVPKNGVKTVSVTLTR